MKEPEPLIPKEGEISEADVVKIHKALEATEGRLPPAAELLGVSYERLKMLVDGTKRLRSQWRKDKRDPNDPPLQPEDLLDRKAPRAVVLTQDEKNALALKMQNRKHLTKSLARLGFNDKQLESVTAIEEFAGQHFNETLTILNGGCVRQSIQLMFTAQHLEQTYLQREDLKDADRKFWWDTYFRILENIRMMNDSAQKAALTRAMIDIKKQQVAAQGKAGFGVPTVAIQINDAKTVTTTQQPPSLPTYEGAGKTGEPPIDA